MMSVVLRPLRRLNRRSVSDQVFQQLKTQILQRAWPPGSRLPSETVLAKRLGVSRVSVREGVHRLASLGLLETRHGEGTFVRGYGAEVQLTALLPMLALSPARIFEVLEYRRIMEKGTVALVVEKAGPEDIEALKRRSEEMVERQTDADGFADADLEFHMALARASGNPIVLMVNSIIRDVLSVSMEDIVRALGTGDGLDYHKRIIDAIEARDSPRAQSLMEEHVVRTIERLRSAGAFPVTEGSP